MKKKTWETVAGSDSITSPLKSQKKLPALGKKNNQPYRKFRAIICKKTYSFLKKIGLKCSILHDWIRAIQLRSDPATGGII